VDNIVDKSIITEDNIVYKICC